MFLVHSLLAIGLASLLTKHHQRGILSRIYGSTDQDTLYLSLENDDLIKIPHALSNQDTLSPLHITRPSLT